MVYTVTFNPALDVMIGVDDLQLGGINRTSSQEIFYGGKGVNVSYVLRSLGRTSTALGFLAGTIGRAMNSALQEDGLPCEFVMLPEGETRINTKLRTPVADGGLSETAFNAGGPRIDDESLEKLFARLRKTGDGDVVVLSGGVPGGTSKQVYADILKLLADKDVLVVVDATDELLTNAVPHRPFLIKPNDEELAEIVGCSPDDRERLLEGARELQSRGAVNVMVSRGGKGAFLVDEEGGLHEMDALSGTLVNSVGAGDSTVAGFTHGYLEGREKGWDTHRVYAHAFALAMACGAATAFSEGLASREAIDALLLQAEGGQVEGGE